MDGNFIDTPLGLLLDPFKYSFMTRALMVTMLVGIIAPAVGCYVVTRGLGFMGDAMAHAVLPGMVIAFLLGIAPIWGAAVTGIAVALLIGYLTHRTNLSEDIGIGILFAGMFALGLALLSAADGITLDLESVLLGQVLGVSMTDVYITASLAAAVFAALYLFHKELVFVSFDRIGAEVAGIPTRMLDYLLLALLAIIIVITLQAVGLVLVVGMLIIPAATAFLLVRRFASAMAAGACIGALSAVCGLYMSFYLNLPSGPAMTLVATALFILAAAFKRRMA